MQEQWRRIESAPEYEVSNEGRVRSHKKTGRPTPYILRQNPDSGGYRNVSLWDGPSRRTRKVHSLVLEAFVGPRPDGLSVRHLDGDQTNNNLANLAYGTHAENMRDRRTHGTDPNVRKTHCPQNHPYADDNLWVDRTGRRHCRRCNAERSARYYWTKKAISA